MAPFFSIIVPVHNQAAFLDQCLSSVQEQSFGDFECLCMDDRSSDESPGIIERYQADDKRFQLHTSASNLGLGETRNTAVALATGKYLLFLDGDDWLRQDALSRISETLDENYVDLVFFDHYLYYESGTTIDSNQRRFFTNSLITEHDTDRKRLMRVFHVSWNKAYKRSFYQSNHFAYPKGFYEDFIVSYQAAVKARSIVCCSEPLIFYRQRPGTFPNRPNRKSRNVDHFQIFDRYQALFDSLDPEYADIYKPLLYTKMLNQLAATLCERVREDPSARRRFFSMMKRFADTYQPDENVYFSYKDRIIYTMIKSDRMQALLAINFLYRHYSRIAQFFKSR